MEHLVKKSLDINPGLRSGRSTGEVLEGLRREAAEGASLNSAPPAAEGRPRLSKEERRKQTIRFFLEQKLEEFSEEAEGIRVRQEQLAREQRELQQQYAEDITDFLGMMAGGGDAPEAREVLRNFRKFLADLGLTEAEAIARARRG